MIKTIVFDCWGTLFISGDSLLHPFEVFAQRIGCTLKNEAYLKMFESHLMLKVYVNEICGITIALSNYL